VVILTVPAVRELFQLAAASSQALFISIAVAFACVFWFEIYKASLKEVQ
jgi:hypothetical protein